MSVHARKVVYHVHMEAKDREDHVIGELETQEPLTLYAHQLDQLPERVDAIVRQAETQAKGAD